VEVSILPPDEVLRLLPEPVQVRLVTDMEKGEALVDSRGTGSFYRGGRGRVCKVSLMRIQRAIFIEKHISKLGARVKLDTQQLRCNVINKLTDLLNAVSGMAKSRGLEVKDRQEWTHIAGYIAPND